MSYNHATGSFDGYISVPSNFEAGSYQVDSLGIYDTSDNIATYYSSLNSYLLGGAQFTVSGTTGADITKPSLESISVDKFQATVGDTIKVSIKAIDDVAINMVYLYYKTPVTKKSLYVSMSYNHATGSFDGYISVPSNFEVGSYQVDSLSLYDTSDNIATYYSSSSSYLLGGAQFNVITEKNPPEFKDFSISKKVIDPGEAQTFTVEAADDTNLKEAVINYVSPISHTIRSYKLSFNGTNFTNEYNFDENSEVGQWLVDSVVVTDTNGNSVTRKSDEFDFGSSTFTVLKPILPLSTYVVKTSETWANKTVNGDVYISPGAILTLSSDVTINGNIFVLGGLRSLGGFKVTGTLSANSIYFGYYTPSDGVAVFSGSNSIYSMTATNHVLQHVPVTLHNLPLISSEGKINLTGATLPFVKLEINGRDIPIKSNGTFRITDFPIGTSEKLEITTIDPSGFVKTISYDVASDIFFEKELTRNTEVINGQTLFPNTKINILKGEQVIGYATTDSDGKFLINIKDLKENSLLEFELLDEQSNLILSKSILVKDITAPTISGVNRNGIYNQDVTITFNEGEATLNGSPYVSGTVISNEGTYVLVVTDEAGNRAEVNFTIDKSPPVINGITHNAYYNRDLTISFNEGQATLNGANFTSGTTVTVPGTYTLVVTDLAGNKTTINFTIDKTAPKAYGVINNGYYNNDVVISFNEGKATLNGVPYVSGSVQSYEGNYVLVVSDEAGNREKINFTIDKSLPVINGITHNAYYNKDIKITFSEGKATLNGKAFASSTIIKADGVYTLVVTDSAGNTTTLKFTIDKTPPTVSGVINNAFYNKDVKITFSEGKATLNSKSITNGTIVTAAEVYTLVVTDTAGNITTTKFTIDKTAPKVSGISNNAYSNKDVKVVFNEGKATLNGKAFASSTIIKRDGIYTLVVTDTAGNKTTVKFTIDKTPPTVQSVSAVKTNSTYVTGTAESYSVVNIKIGTKVYTSSTDKNGKFKVIIPKQKKNTAIYVTARDSAGNISKSVKVIVM